MVGFKSLTHAGIRVAIPATLLFAASALHVSGAHADSSITGAVVTGTLTVGSPVVSDPNTQPIADFTDADGDTGATNGCYYTVTIDWGDGSAVEGARVNNDLQNPSNCDVYALDSHVYSNPGTYTITVSIVDNRDGDSVDGTGQITVSGGAPQLQAYNQDGVVAGETYQMDMGTFSGDCSAYSAVIDWGDGTAFYGQIRDNGDGTCEVLGTHAFPNGGTYQATVTITKAATGVSSSASSTVTVATPD